MIRDFDGNLPPYLLEVLPIELHENAKEVLCTATAVRAIRKKYGQERLHGFDSRRQQSYHNEMTFISKAGELITEFLSSNISTSKDVAKCIIDLWKERQQDISAHSDNASMVAQLDALDDAVAIFQNGLLKLELAVNVFNREHQQQIVVPWQLKYAADSVVDVDGHLVVPLGGDVIDADGLGFLQDVCSVCSTTVQNGLAHGHNVERWHCLDCSNASVCKFCKDCSQLLGTVAESVKNGNCFSDLMMMFGHSDHRLVKESTHTVLMREEVQREERLCNRIFRMFQIYCSRPCLSGLVEVEVSPSKGTQKSRFASHDFPKMAIKTFAEVGNDVAWLIGIWVHLLHQARSDPEQNAVAQLPPLGSDEARGVVLCLPGSPLWYELELSLVCAECHSIGVYDQWSAADILHAIKLSGAAGLATTEGVFATLTAAGMSSQCPKLRFVVLVDVQSIDVSSSTSTVKKETSHVAETSTGHQPSDVFARDSRGAFEVHSLRRLLIEKDAASTPCMFHCDDNPLDADERGGTVGPHENKWLTKSTATSSCLKMADASEQMVSILFSSGTTGSPKGIAIYESTWGKDVDDAQHTRPLVSLSMYPPCWGADKLLVWRTLLNGGSVVFRPPGSGIATLFRHMSLVKPSSIDLVPSLCKLLRSEVERSVPNTPPCNPAGTHSGATAVVGEDESRSPTDDVRKVQLSLQLSTLLGPRLVYVAVGGAVSDPQTMQWLRDHVYCPVIEAYGTTESGGISSNYQISRRVKVKLVDRPDLGFLRTDLPHPRGEICVLSPMQVPPHGWICTDAEREAALRRYLPDGYFCTGDIGEVDSLTGSIRVLDRASSLFKLTSGVFVSPEKVEARLGNHPIVKHIVVTPDRAKEALLAIVFLNKSAIADFTSSLECDGSISPSELLAELRVIGSAAGLVHYELPERVLIDPLDCIFTANLKINRVTVARRHQAVLSVAGGGAGEAVDILVPSVSVSSFTPDDRSTTSSVRNILSVFGAVMGRPLGSEELEVDFASLGLDSMRLVKFHSSLVAMNERQGRRTASRALLSLPLASLQAASVSSLALLLETPSSASSSFDQLVTGNEECASVSIDPLPSPPSQGSRFDAESSSNGAGADLGNEEVLPARAHNENEHALHPSVGNDDVIDQLLADMNVLQTAVRHFTTTAITTSVDGNSDGGAETEVPLKTLEIDEANDVQETGQRAEEREERGVLLTGATGFLDSHVLLAWRALFDRQRQLPASSTAIAKNSLSSDSEGSVDYLNDDDHRTFACVSSPSRSSDAHRRTLRGDNRPSPFAVAPPLFVLVRSRGRKSSVERLNKVLRSLGWDMSSPCPWLRVLDGDISKPHFGLTSEAYHRLCRSVVTVIHCAANVKFLGVEDGYRHLREDNVLATLHMLEFLSSTNNFSSAAPSEVGGLSSSAPVAAQHKSEGPEHSSFDVEEESGRLGGCGKRLHYVSTSSVTDMPFHSFDEFRTELKNTRILPKCDAYTVSKWLAERTFVMFAEGLGLCSGSSPHQGLKSSSLGPKTLVWRSGYISWSLEGAGNSQDWINRYVETVRCLGSAPRLGPLHRPSAVPFVPVDMLAEALALCALVDSDATSPSPPLPSGVPTSQQNSGPKPPRSVTSSPLPPLHIDDRPYATITIPSTGSLWAIPLQGISDLLAEVSGGDSVDLVDAHVWLAAVGKTRLPFAPLSAAFRRRPAHLGADLQFLGASYQRLSAEALAWPARPAPIDDDEEGGCTATLEPAMAESWEELVKILSRFDVCTKIRSYLQFNLSDSPKEQGAGTDRNSPMGHTAWRLGLEAYLSK